MTEQAPDGKIRVKRVGNYIIGKTIGEGSFSKVKLGTHLVTNERVALKIIEKAKITESSDIERITREIQILKLLDHPNVVKLYEIIDTPRHLYIIQEFLSNGELFDFIVAHKRLPEPQAANFIVQVFSGLNYLHSKFVSHRDLKPENCVLDKNNNIKIIDFGLSNVFKNYAYLKTACGSPAYACPEMIKGEVYNGAKADTWSCGIILYAMLCGALPFESSTTQGLYCKILSGNVYFPDYVSEGAKDVVRQLLTIDPNKRAKIQDIVNHSWIQENWTKINPNQPLKLTVIDDDQSLHLRTLQQMKTLNFDVDQTIKSLNLNKHNAQTATYVLLTQQIKQGKLEAEPEPTKIEDRAALAQKIGLRVKNDKIFDAEGNEIGALTMKIDALESKADDTLNGTDTRVEIAENVHVRADLHNAQKDLDMTPVEQRLQEDEKVSAVPTLSILPQLKDQLFQQEVTQRALVDKENEDIRVYAGTVTPGMSSKMPPDLMLNLIEEVFKKLKIKFVKEKQYLFKCQRLNVIMSCEMCKVQGQEELVCVVFRRMTGDAWVYKELCQQILSGMGL
ncbi:Kinase, CAMK CAMKL [Spironucleus salmonicida]|uniref:non-specific serine/threonine protein kinase n=1 Tax=Spironucleus salmonicida TaxID=348837 RepID=V6LC04_9EUKA|nr:Kinase, CAMK CAMKL [Spironucleus salmonicida]|eukprot:EST41753.1 Kinase, CAMK CAMKL [Spironucleus salmonicida]